MVGRLVESWSHANVDMSFGRVGERLLWARASTACTNCARQSR
jgi:hypothetical protein